MQVGLVRWKRTVRKARRLMIPGLRVVLPQSHSERAFAGRHLADLSADLAYEFCSSSHGTEEAAGAKNLFFPRISVTWWSHILVQAHPCQLSYVHIIGVTRRTKHDGGSDYESVRFGSLRLARRHVPLLIALSALSARTSDLLSRNARTKMPVTTYLGG